MPAAAHSCTFCSQVASSGSDVVTGSMRVSSSWHPWIAAWKKVGSSLLLWADFSDSNSLTYGAGEFGSPAAGGDGVVVAHEAVATLHRDELKADPKFHRHHLEQSALVGQVFGLVVKREEGEEEKKQAASPAPLWCWVPDPFLSRREWWRRFRPPIGCHGRWRRIIPLPTFQILYIH